MLEKLKDNLRYYFSTSPKIILVVMLVTMTATIWIVNTRKTVIISIDGKATKIVTYKSNLKEVLQSKNIAVYPKDEVTPGLRSEVKNGEKICIKRAVDIELIYGGKEIETKSSKDTVLDFLNEEGIRLNDLDYVTPGEHTSLKEGLKVVVTRVVAKTLETVEDISYTTVVQNSDDMEKGTSRVVQNGENGKKRTSVKILYKDGKEVSRETISEVVLKNPVQKVVSVGTLGVLHLSRGKVLYTKCIRFKTTAYSADSACTGKSPGSDGYGVTASGARAVRSSNGYSTIAVDPRVIPIGTRLYIEGYGYAIAEDTGSSIIGKWIDLFMNSYGAACDWGVRYVNVYFIK